MRVFSIYIPVLIALITHLPFSEAQKGPNALRCQCSTDLGGIKCHGDWCEGKGNATHIAGCAVVKKHTSSRQYLVCVRVSQPAKEGYCEYDPKRNMTSCWCTGNDYCNIDLVDRIREKRVSEETDDDFTVETNSEFNENNLYSDEEQPVLPDTRETPQVIGDVVDMRKPVEPKILSPEEESLPPWRRINPLNSDAEWKPPPPPPMPEKHQPATTTSTSTTTTTTTTTTTAPITTTTLSHQEIMRQYEERRRRLELERENELKRRAEHERRRLEERRHLESQYETRRRFGEESRNWLVPEAPVETTTSTTTTIATPPPTTTTLATPPPTTTTLATPPPTTTTTTTTPPPTTTIRTTTTPKETASVPSILTVSNMAQLTPSTEKETKDYKSYYKGYVHRRPFDLNPTQISINNISAIVYPPTSSVIRAKSSSTPSSTSIATSSTTTPTTTTAYTTRPTPRTTITTTTKATTEPPTTTSTIIYPPPNFKIATKSPRTTTTTTEVAYAEDSVEESNRKMVEMPQAEESIEHDGVVMYTPKPPAYRPPLTPSVRTPAEKMDEYKKLVEVAEPSSTSIILPSFISLIVLLLL